MTTQRQTSAMAMFDKRTPEEKAAADAQQAAEGAARAWAASPPGQAQAAYQNGDGFFQVEIPHSQFRGFANLMWSSSGTSSRQVHRGGATDVLSAVEAQGWRLEHASWVYVQTGQNSRDKFLASGQHVVVSGDVVGIYLFRRRQ